MTEAEWLACEDPTPMLDFLRGKTSDRKLRLFACACCRRVWDLLLRKQSRTAIEIAESQADGGVTGERLNRAWSAASKVSRSFYVESGQSKPYAAAKVVETVCWEPEQGARAASEGVRRIKRSRTEQNTHSALVRDIFENPFHPVDVNPSWLTSTVLALAQGIYTERAFDRMPILADALQDAGCDREDVLSHCRSVGPHVRGCWVIEMLTDRK